MTVGRLDNYGLFSPLFLFFVRRLPDQGSIRTKVEPIAIEAGNANHAIISSLGVGRRNVGIHARLPRRTDDRYRRRRVTAAGRAIQACFVDCARREGSFVSFARFRHTHRRMVRTKAIRANESADEWRFRVHFGL